MPVVLTFTERNGHMSRRKIFIIIAILAIVVVGIFVVLALIGPAVENVYTNIVEESAEVGEDFLVSLKNANYEQAFSLFSNDLTQEIGNAENLESIFIGQKLFDTWEYELYEADSDTGETAVGLIGEMTYQDGSKSDFQIYVVYEDSTFKVAAFGFNQ